MLVTDMIDTDKHIYIQISVFLQITSSNDCQLYELAIHSLNIL